MSVISHTTWEHTLLISVRINIIVYKLHQARDSGGVMRSKRRMAGLQAGVYAHLQLIRGYTMGLHQATAFREATEKPRMPRSFKRICENESRPSGDYVVAIAVCSNPDKPGVVMVAFIGEHRTLEALGKWLIALPRYGIVILDFSYAVLRFQIDCSVIDTNLFSVPDEQH